MSVNVTAPATATAGQAFLVSAIGNLHNNGPAGSIVVDTTFSVLMPGDCTVLANNPVTVPDRLLPASVPVGLMRFWSMRCNDTGPHDFTVNVSTALAPGQSWVESNPANNSGSGGGSTTINAPTPTPSPAP
jgi:hypothetical protein